MILSNKNEKWFNKILRRAGVFCWINLILILTLTPSIVFSQEKSINSPTPSQEFADDGIKVEFSMSHIDEEKPKGEFKEGDDVKFRFKISDTLTGKGLSGTFPAAWMSLLSEAELEGESVDCLQKVSTYLGGNISQRAELDLNVYYVLTLNESATISVVDPLFSFGGSQLLTLINLNSPGSDWVVSKNQSFVYVAMPKAKQIAVIRTSDWKVIQNIDIKGIPSKLTLQNDNHYLWVGYEDESRNDGVAVINTDDLRVMSHIKTGKGIHDLVVDNKNHFVYVTNKLEGTTSIIDVQSLKKIKDITTGVDPISIAYSTKANSVFIAHQSDGSVTVIDGKHHKVVKTISTNPGIFQIKFEPEGRLAFGVNPTKDELYIIDASNNKLVQVGHMESQPDQVNFSDKVAYIRHHNSPTVLMVPLDAVGREGSPVQVADFPAGQAPPCQGVRGCLASGMVKAPGINGMLIVNSPDESIYYYTEGMAAPKGSFNTYGSKAVAVEVIDRSIEEQSPGVYETIAKLRSPGMYDVVFFTDAPRLTHCFSAEVKSDEDHTMKRLVKKFGNVGVNFINPPKVMLTNMDFKVNFKLADIKSGETLSGLVDVQIMGMMPSSNWHKRINVTEVDDSGNYAAELNFKKAGTYYLYVQSISQEFTFDNPQYHIIQVFDNPN